jgi:hypothetical protein
LERGCLPKSSANWAANRAGASRVEDQVSWRALQPGVQ